MALLLARLYGKSYCTNPDVSVGIDVDKLVKFYVKVFICWARGCQGSCPVRGQVLLCDAADIL